LRATAHSAQPARLEPWLCAQQYRSRVKAWLKERVDEQVHEWLGEQVNERENEKHQKRKQEQWLYP
jgi:hypothetical protein